MLRPHRTVHGAAIVLAMVFPTVLTLAYFVLLADSPAWLQQAVYAIGKTVQFAFPAVLVAMLLARRRFGSPGIADSATRMRRLAAIAGLQARRAKLRLR